ncbi:MAG: HlyD family secretion protein [Gammaproteobacteria bacterium]|nr:HlyD family secretion protein [Gammaproteobacteria bacterium]
MDLLLIMTYVALCVVIFKAFKIPLNKWTVPTAMLGGVVIIGALMLLMNYNHPFSETLRQYYVTTPIIAEVRGRVVEVPVQANQAVKKGDILFKLDAKPFEDKLSGLKEELNAAQKDLARAETLFQTQSASERSLDQARARVADLQAKIDDASFQLEQTIVRAPTDGYVTQLALRPGMMALPLATLLTFVHQEEPLFVGWFRQNSLLRLQKGYAAEVTLDGMPGEVFKGEVAQVFPVIGEGQVRPQADLLRYSQQRVPGRVAVAIRVTDPRFDASLVPVGVFGQAAVYSDHFSHVGVMRKVLLRMAGWMNYIYPFH